MKEVIQLSAMKKGTKLTNNPKDYMLRVRMDNSTLDKLDFISKKENLTRSEVVRKSIQEKYDKIKK